MPSERFVNELNDQVARELAAPLVLGELGPVCLELDRRQSRGVCAEEELQQPKVAHLGELRGGLPAPALERLAPLVGELVELAPAPALLASLGDVPAAREALRLGVELGVLERPEETDRARHELLEPVRRGLARPAEQAEHDVRGRGEPGLLH